MKILKKLFFLVFIVLFSCDDMKTIKMKPIELRISDSLNKPVKYQKVYFSILKEYYKPFLFFIPGHNAKVTYEVFVYTTNEAGYVFIPSQNVKIRKHEYLIDNFIYINIDIDVNKIKPSINLKQSTLKRKRDHFIDYFNLIDFQNVECFYNPLKKYRGIVIIDSFYDISLKEMGGTYRQKFDIIYDISKSQKNLRSYKIQLKEYNIRELENYKKRKRESDRKGVVEAEIKFKLLRDRYMQENK